MHNFVDIELNGKKHVMVWSTAVSIMYDENERGFKDKVDTLVKGGPGSIRASVEVGAELLRAGDNAARALGLTGYDAPPDAETLAIVTDIDKDLPVLTDGILQAINAKPRVEVEPGGKGKKGKTTQ